jgi:protein O-mannosyl-transferase
MTVPRTRRAHERAKKADEPREPGVQTVGPVAGGRSWKPWAAMGLLVVAIGVVYSNSLHGPFLFDDFPSIVTNQSLRHLWSLQVLAASEDAVTTTGRPVVNLSLAINYAIGGLNVEGYHLVNLSIHALAALALFGLVRRTLLLPKLSAQFGAASTGLALVVSLLWAIHPLQTESVSYIVQRAEALVGLFFLLTLYCLLRGTTATRGSVWYSVAVATCGLGMASKEVMVSAPLLALLYDRIFITGSFKEGLRRRLRWWLALAATWALLALSVHLSHERGGSAGFGLGMTAWEYARTQFGCILHYLRLAFWPSPLVLDYGNAVVSGAVSVVPSALAVLALVATTVVTLVLRPMAGFLGVGFFAILAPTSSVVPLAGQTEAEHRMYLPLAAVVVLVVLGAYQVAGRLGHRWRRAMAVLVPIAAAALGWGTYRRNEVYKSDFAIWDNDVAHAPRNYRAYNNRGNSFMAKGQLDAAIGDFGKSIAISPRYAKAYNGRGHALSAQGRHDEAIRDYDRAIKLSPDFADAYHGRGTAYAAKGQIDAALKDYDRAIALDPSFDEAYLNRGRAYDGKGEYDAAIRDYDRAVELRPDYAEAYNNRGGAYEAKGQVDAAIKDYDKAIRLMPNFAEAYTNRGNFHQGKGQVQAAIHDYDKAIALKPDLAAAYYNRALARCQTKAYDQAWADVRMYRSLGGTPDPTFVAELVEKSGRSE